MSALTAIHCQGREYAAISTHFAAIEVSISEETDEGKPHVRFCEGPSFPHCLKERRIIC